MPEGLFGGWSVGRPPYRPVMKRRSTVAPRSATTARIERDELRREGRAARRPSGYAAAGAGAVLAIALAACSPGASTGPIGSLALPSLAVALPSLNVSAAASAASGLALAALDQTDAAITANQTPTGLTSDEASALHQLTAGVRSGLQSGDVTAARTAIDTLSTKVDGFAARLNTDAGKQLTAAIAALKAAMAAN